MAKSLKRGEFSKKKGFKKADQMESFRKIRILKINLTSSLGDLSVASLIKVCAQFMVAAILSPFTGE